MRQASRILPALFCSAAIHRGARLPSVPRFLSHPSSDLLKAVICLSTMRVAASSRVALIAGGLPEAEVLETVREINVKAGWPATGCLVLDESEEARRGR